MPEFTREEIIALEIMSSLVQIRPEWNRYEMARAAFDVTEAFLYVSDERKKAAVDKAAE